MGATQSVNALDKDGKEIQTLLDSDHFKWLLEPSISALWTVFSLIWGTGSAGLMYYALVWTIELLTVTKVEE